MLLFLALLLSLLSFQVVVNVNVVDVVVVVMNTFHRFINIKEENNKKMKKIKSPDKAKYIIIY